jgi:hypothetical protein
LTKAPARRGEGPLISEFVSALKDRVSASVQSVIWLAVAGLAAVIAVGFLLAALHTWLAIWYGPIQASLAFAGAFLLIAIIVYVATLIRKRRAAHRMKLQKERLLVQPASLATTLMSHFIGPKQTSVLMMVALAAGFLMARPGRRAKD